MIEINEEIEKEMNANGANAIAIAIEAESVTNIANLVTDTPKNIEKEQDSSKGSSTPGTPDAKPNTNWINLLTSYVNMTYDEIKERMIKEVKEDSNIEEATRILQTKKGSVEISSIILSISNSLSSIIPIITTNITAAYNATLQELQAQHKALQRIKEARTRAATEDVSKAIAEEPTMECKTMKSLMNKVVDKRMEKNEKRKSKNSKGGKKVSFSKAPPSTVTTTTTTNTNKRRYKKRKAQSHPNQQQQNQSNSSKPTSHNQKEQSPTHQTNHKGEKNKKRKVFKSKKWIRPNPKNDSQDA